MSAATAKVVAGLVGFFGAQKKDDALWLRIVLQQDYPQRTTAEIDELVHSELRRQVEFERRMRERLERDMPVALRESDPVKRQQRIDGILARERNYLAMRQQAMLERSAARAEHMDVRAASPEGAYWKLDPTVKKHTLDCLLMGEKFWPWEVLNEIHPLLHTGCQCHLYTKSEAVERGWIVSNHHVDVADAVKSARSIMRRAGRVQEAAYPGEIEVFVEERLEEAARGPRSEQACHYFREGCKNRATKSLIWADGRAYIPVCDTHDKTARDTIRDQHDEVTRVVLIESEFSARLHPRNRRGEWARTFYHVAPTSQRPNIAVGGLEDKLTGKGIFVWDNPEDAAVYHGLVGGDVWEVNAEGHPFEDDPWWSEDEGRRARWAGPGRSLVTRKRIPPSALRLHEGALLHEAHSPAYERETARIKERAQTPQAKARHTFKAAMWTHPNGHPRCSLCGQEEPIGGVCNGKPTKAQAEAWVAKQEREDAKLGMKSGHYVTDGGEIKYDLGEADFDEREHPRGRGGRFIRVWLKGEKHPVYMRVQKLGKQIDGHVIDNPGELTGEQRKIHVNDVDRIDEMRGTPEGELVQKELIGGEAARQHLNLLFHYSADAEPSDAWPITDDERDALDLYRDTRGYQKINDTLRGGVSNTEETLSKIVKHGREPKTLVTRTVGEWADLIGSAIHKAPRTGASLNMFLYRGVRDADAVFGGDPKPGQRVTDPAFVSTTTNSELARNFAVERPHWLTGPEGEPRKPTVLEIEMPPGIQGAWMASAFGLGEFASEFVLPRGSTFEVTDVRHDLGEKPGEKLRVVEARLVVGVQEAAEAIDAFWILEAEYEERLHPRGREGKWIRKPIRNVLRALTPQLKPRGAPEHRAPLQERGSEQGRYVWLRGRYVFVPRHREFRRKLDHATFSSPAGSTNIYRNGYLVQVEGEPPPPHHQDLNPPARPDVRNIPGTAEYSPAGGEKSGGEPTPEHAADLALAVLARQEENRGALADRVDVALTAMSPDVPPVSVGDEMPAVGDVLSTRGFREEGPPRGDAYSASQRFLHGLSGASVFVSWSKRGALPVIDVDWTPGRPGWDAPQEPLGRAPRTWEEFADEVRGVAYRLAHEHGVEPIVGEVRLAGLHDRFEGVPYDDHAGTHNSYHGLILLGPEVHDVLKPGRGYAQGEHLAWYAGDTTGAARSIWAGYKVATHEAIHGAGNVVGGSYADPVVKGIEEALTEELAHVEAVALMRANQVTEPLGWLRANPQDYKAVGTYPGYRRALDRILTQAGVAPELREDFVRHLRWEVDPAMRDHELARAIEDGPNAANIPDAVGYVREAFRQPNALGFQPILRPDLRDFPSADGVVWNGQRIGVGSVVTIQTGYLDETRDARGKRRGRWKTKRVEVEVLSLGNAAHPGASFKMDVRPLDAGDLPNVGHRVMHNVLDSQVVAVRPDGREQGEAPSVVVRPAGGLTEPELRVAVGDTISYDGRADGGRSEAVVSAVYDLAVPAGVSPDIPRYAIEAVTTERSLKPDTLVYLTEERMSGVQVVSGSAGTVTQLPQRATAPRPIAVAASPGDPPEPTVRVRLPAGILGELMGLEADAADGSVPLQDRLADRLDRAWALTDRGKRPATLELPVSVARYLAAVALPNAEDIWANRADGAGDRRKLRGWAKASATLRAKLAAQLADTPGQKGGGDSEKERNDAVLRALGAKDLEGDQWSRPDLYERHPRSGFMVRNDVPRTSVIHEPGKPVRVHDTVPNQWRANEEEVAGSVRPPKYLFRAVHEDDYQQALKRGFLQSDGRMNLDAREGTVAALSDPTWYLPGKLASSPHGTQLGRVLRIRYRDEDGWTLDTDGYAKTAKPIPMSRVDAAPQFAVTKGVIPSSITGSPVEHISTEPTGVGMEWAGVKGGDEPIRATPTVEAAKKWLEDGEAEQRMLLWHGTPRADDIRAMGFLFTDDAVGDGGGPAIWLSDSRSHAEGYGTPLRVAAKFRKPLMVRHTEGSEWSMDFEDALRRGGVDLSGYHRLASGAVASPAVIAREHGFDAVARRYPDTVYGPEVPEHLRVVPGTLIVTAFDLDGLRVIQEADDEADSGEKGGGEFIPDDQRVYIAEAALERGGLDGGRLGGGSDLLLGHPNHPKEEGRAESARISKLAQEISGDPDLRVHITNEPVWGAGAGVIAAYDPVFNKVSIRPDASKLSFLHEIAHAMTRTEHGDVNSHGPEFVETAARLYGKYLSPEAERTFRNLASPPETAGGYDYTVRSPLDEYTKGGVQGPVNRLLTGRVKASERHREPEQRAFIDRLDRQFAGAAPTTGTLRVQRGQTFEPEPDEHGIVRTPQYLSTTTNSASTYLQRPTKLHILIPPGSKVLRANEQVLLPRDAVFRHDGVRGDTHRRTYLGAGEEGEQRARGSGPLGLVDAGAPSFDPATGERSEAGRPGWPRVRVKPSPEMIGIGFDVDPGRYQDWHNEVQRRTGILPRGTPISPEDPRIPDTVYHATTNLPAVLADGYLRARGAGGLGGDPNDRLVSMTTDPAVAAQLAADLRLLGGVAKEFGAVPESTWDDQTKKWDWGLRPTWGARVRRRLSEEARRQGFSFGEVNPDRSPEQRQLDERFWEGMAQGSDLGGWMNQWFAARQTQTGVQNPVIFDAQNVALGVDPDKVGVVSIPRENLNNGALLTDFDLGKRGLSEIRSYGDVAVGPSAVKGGGEPSRVWEQPIPDEPPRWRQVGPGVLDSEDGRLTMYRIEGVRPTAWNVEWSTDYAYAVQGADTTGGFGSPLYAAIVDGAASRKDAEALFRRDWPKVRANMLAFEGVHPVLEALGVPVEEHAEVAAQLLALPPGERRGFVEGWLDAVGADPLGVLLEQF